MQFAFVAQQEAFFLATFWTVRWHGQLLFFIVLLFLDNDPKIFLTGGTFLDDIFHRYCYKPYVITSLNVEGYHLPQVLSACML